VSTFLIGTRKARVACHIGRENGGQPAFDAFRGQRVLPNRMGRTDYRPRGAILTAKATGAISF
jgi:hypothetical protein